jgi:hypothetical protein
LSKHHLAPVEQAPIRQWWCVQGSACLCTGCSSGCTLTRHKTASMACPPAAGCNAPAGWRFHSGRDAPDQPSTIECQAMPGPNAAAGVEQVVQRCLGRRSCVGFVVKRNATGVKEYCLKSSLSLTPAIGTDVDLCNGVYSIGGLVACQDGLNSHDRTRQSARLRV